MRYDYKVVPAPERGEKTRGVKGAEGRFAAAVERIMNDMAARGWEYLRSDTLPSEERSGLTQTVTVWRNLLVFRRPAAGDVAGFEPRMLEAPLMLQEPVVAGAARPVAASEPGQTSAQTSPQVAPADPGKDAPEESHEAAAAQTAGDPVHLSPAPDAAPEEDEATDFVMPPLARRNGTAQGKAEDADNGVEDTQSMQGLSGALMARAARVKAAGNGA